MISLKLHKRMLYLLVGIAAFFSFLLTGCEEKKTSSTEITYRNAKAQVRVPEASHTKVIDTDLVSLDISHIDQGYIMLQYLGDKEKVQLQITSPDNISCNYPVVSKDQYFVFPLTGGNGIYQLKVFESADAEKNLYAVVFTQELEVVISDEFSPFLYPNFYVNFKPESECVALGEALAEKCVTDLDVVNNIYHYVIANISYDTELAVNVQSSYTPDPDQTIASGKGICLDYASLMASMLRSQRIPTRLEVGYVDELYHAWISCFVDEIGWVDNIIEFDGVHWSLMDPTLAANNDRDEVNAYVGDGSNYLLKYTY